MDQDAQQPVQPQADLSAAAADDFQPGVPDDEHKKEDREPGERRSESRAKARFLRWLLEPQVVMAVATAVMAVATVSYTLVTALTLGKLGKSLDVAREANRLNSDALALARQSFEENRKGAVESNQRALEALDLTRESNRLTAATLDLNRRRERAWLLPTISGQLTIEPNAKIPVTVQARNSGKTAAVNATMTSAAVAVPGKPESVIRKMLSFPHPMAASVSGAIAPNEVLLQNFELGALDATTVHAIQQGRVTLVIWGGVSYTDQFDIHGQTSYCRVYHPKRREFVFCPAIPDEAK